MNEKETKRRYTLMIERFFLFFLIGFFSMGCKPSQEATAVEEPKQKSATIEWTTWSQLVDRQKQEERLVMVTLHTDWCGWCRRMEKTTFKDAVVVDLINTYYHPISFDAEYREDITFLGETYSFQSKGSRGYHQLAYDIALGQLSYPTTVFLNEDFEILTIVPGFLDAEDFETILMYFAEGHHIQGTLWDSYSKNYVPKKR